MKNNLHTNRKALNDVVEQLKAGDPFATSGLDDFDKDAAQGWADSGVSLSAMKALDSKTSRMFGYNNNWMLFAVMSVVVSAIVVGSLLLFEDNKEQKQPQLTVEQTDLTTPEKFDTLIALNKTEQLTAEEVQQKHVMEERGSVPENVEPLFSSIDFEKISPEILEPLPPVIENMEVKISKQKTAKEIYLHRMKAIDYSEYRNKPEISIEQVILTGLPANFESEEELQQAETTTKIVQIPYMDYLEKTMSYVDKGKWKQALTRFEEILKAYPDDVNAMFYSGMCYYNLQQYQQACNQFSASLQLNFSNFNEEATWYLAKSRMANNEKALAKELFIAIRDNKGYYAKQAEKLLKDWK